MFLGQVLAVWIMIAGLAWIVGGQKLATKVIEVPAKFLGKLAIDALSAVAKLLMELTSKLFRSFGRWLDCRCRRLCNLPPRS